MNIKQIFPLLALFFISCGANGVVSDAHLLDAAGYEKSIDGEQYELYTLLNSDIAVQITNYGGRMLSVIVPDREGIKRNINWREESIEEVLESPYIYAGAIIGRSANRTGNGGRVEIDGVEYQLSVDGNNQHNAGGVTGLSFVVWDGVQGVNEYGEPTLKLSHRLADGHEGYPGNVVAEATYTLTNDNSLRLEFRATTDAATYVNFTHHPFFNLHGDILTSTNSHYLTIHAQKYTPSAADGILSGDVDPVAGTPLDFRTPHTIGERVDVDHDQINRRYGYDANYLIDRVEEGIVLSAELYEPATGIEVEIYSDQPAMQLYGGPYQGKMTQELGLESRPLRYGVGLEAQNCPNTPNCEAFPSAILYPDEEYHKTIIYKFKTNL